MEVALEACRNATGPDIRHLRLIDTERPLCETSERQTGAGGGQPEVLLNWPTCRRCKVRAVKLVRDAGL